MTPTHKIRSTARMLRRDKQFAAANMLEQIARERDELLHQPPAQGYQPIGGDKTTPPGAE